MSAATQTPEDILAEFAALDKRLKSAGRKTPEREEFTALDKRIKKAGYVVPPKPLAVPEKLLPKVEEKPKPSDCSVICAAIKESEGAIIEAIKDGAEKEPPAPPEPKKPTRWKFYHKYDVYNKLIETTAEAI